MKRIFTLLSCFLYSIIVLAKDKPFFAPPTTNSHTLNLTLRDGNQLNFGWTIGNGARRIVVMKAGGAITNVPQNGVDYNHSATFGAGQELAPGSGEFVVSDGVVSSASVTNLTHSTSYNIAIFEYNGTGAATEYLTPGYQPAAQSTAVPPTTAASGISVSQITGNAMTVSWTNGDGAVRMVVAREGSPVNSNPTNYVVYLANSAFGNGNQVGTGNYSVYRSNIGSSVRVTGLKPSTTYHFSIFEYNGNNGPVYLVPGTTASFTTAAGPTVPAGNPTFNNIEGNSMAVFWTAGNGSRRIVIAKAGSSPAALPVNGQDYSANASFGTPSSEIAPGEYVVYDNTGTSFTLTNLVHSTTYHFKIYEYDGTGTGTAYLTTSPGTSSNSTKLEPTTPTGAISFSSIGGNSMTINWASGNGERRLVLMRQGSAVTGVPVNYSVYSANTAFGNGTQVPSSSGNYVVYNGTGNSVTVTALAPATTYHVAIYEYNGTNGPVYISTASTASQMSGTEPTVAATSMVFSSVEGCSMRVNWSSGNGQRRIVIGKQGSAVTATPVDGQVYTAGGMFGSGQEIVANEFVVYDGTGNFVDVSGLNPNTTYHFRVVEYNNSTGTTDYMATGLAGNRITSSYPTSQVTNVNSSQISGSRARITWTNGTGGNSRLVLMKQGSPVDTDPADCVAGYSASTVFGSGTQLGSGNYIVYLSTGTQVDVTNLVPNTTYHVAVYEGSGGSSRMYLRPGVTHSFTTAAHPTVNATNFVLNSSDGDRMVVSWTNGNGQRRIVVAKQGSAVTGTPVNGTDYNASGSFGSGDAIAPGEFVIFDGVSSSTILSNLQPGTTYHFKVFEYDGTGSNTAYLVAGALEGSASTVSAPTLQASNVSFSSVGANSLTINWTNGNGAGRFIIARANQPVNVTPADLTTYGYSQTFGIGHHFGNGNYAVGYTTTTSDNVNGLTSGTTYHFAVFEYNGSSGRVYAVPAATGSVTTPGAPQTQATDAFAGTVGSNTMTISWTNGSGNRRLVLMKQGSAVDAVPVNNTSYSANSFFGSGSQLGTGNYVVHNTTESNVTVTGLQQNTTYHFAVFEYNFFSISSSQFLTTNPATGSATTTSTVPVTMTNFKAIVKNGKVHVSWTTLQESNSSHFEILRSRNGNNFEKVGSVNAAGNSNVERHYSFVDASLSSGQYFYRLNQVDKDQQSELSRVLRVDLSKAFTISITPNPVRSEMRIDGADELVQVQLIDFTGKAIRIYQRSPGKIYSVRGIPAGNYFVRVIGSSSTEVFKILIQ